MNSSSEALKRKYLTFISANIRTRFKLFLRTLWYGPLLFFYILILLVIIFILKVVEPIVKVRIKKMPSDRIGLLAHSADLYLRRQTLYPRSKHEVHLIISGRPANRQFMTMIKRRFFVLENPLLLKLQEIACKYMKNFRVYGELPIDLKSFKEFHDTPPQFSFTKEELAKGRKELLRMGIKSQSSFVCFHSRDKAYLDKAHPYYSRKMWAYHDYRDSDIRNYIPAAEYLSALKLFAVRIGSVIERSIIETSDPRIIDYATHYRSDFMDIYLSANCKFFLGTNAGPNCVARAFNIPVAAVNWIPIIVRLPCKHDLFIPKKLWSIGRKCFLTFREIITSGMDSWGQSEEYARAGIEVVENTADEILALAKEMNERLDNRWVTTQEDEELQKRYNSLFPKHYYPCEVPSRIGTEFLRQNRDLLD